MPMDSVSAGRRAGIESVTGPRQKDDGLIRVVWLP
jgi:hypothetical protein